MKNFKARVRRSCLWYDISGRILMTIYLILSFLFPSRKTAASVFETIDFEFPFISPINRTLSAYSQFMPRDCLVRRGLSKLSLRFVDSWAIKSFGKEDTSISLFHTTSTIESMLDERTIFSCPLERDWNNRREMNKDNDDSFKA